ncbi:MAG: hypothetical protein ACFUZC_04855 [Chthoniobacteraceae bacterium]
MIKTLDPHMVPTTPELNVDWAALGCLIAQEMAAGYRAEWKPHYWDEVENDNARYIAAHDAELSVLWDADNDDEYYRRKRLCRDAWAAELRRILREKRGTLSVNEVWNGTMFSQTVHLQLADGGTITGTLERIPNASPELAGHTMRLCFEVACGEERTLALTSEAEFAPKRWEGAYRGENRQLCLEHEPGGYRHYLGDRDIHCGAGLSLHLPSGEVVDGRYECRLTRDDCTPAFYIALAGDPEWNEQRVIRLPGNAEFLANN